MQIADKNDLKISLYADDAVIFATSSDSESVRHRVQNAFEVVSSWCTRNQINLNTDKTKYCCYGSRYVLKHSTMALLFNKKMLQ